MRPSRRMPSRSLTSVCGRARWVRKVSSRLSRISTLPAGGAGEQSGDDLEIQHFDARAEAAADERLDHADARGVHFQASRQHQMQVVADLGHRLRREPAGARIVVHQAGVRLDLRMIDLGAADRLLAHQIGRGEGRPPIAEFVMYLALDIAGLVVVQQRGARRARVRRGVIGGQLARARVRSDCSARSAVSASMAATAAIGSPR